MTPWRRPIWWRHSLHHKTLETVTTIQPHKCQTDGDGLGLPHSSQAYITQVKNGPCFDPARWRKVELTHLAIDNTMPRTQANKPGIEEGKNGERERSTTTTWKQPMCLTQRRNHFPRHKQQNLSAVFYPVPRTLVYKLEGWLMHFHIRTNSPCDKNATDMLHSISMLMYIQRYSWVHWWVTDSCSILYLGYAKSDTSVNRVSHFHEFC
jgi:hypothetical protein